MVQTLTAVERQLISFILSGEHETLAQLRPQLLVAAVTSRTASDVGFFAHLKVPASAGRLAQRRDLVIGDVHADVDGLEHGAGILLFVREGFLSCLECYTYENALTPSSVFRRLYYMHPSEPGASRLVEVEPRDLAFALRGS